MWTSKLRYGLKLCTEVRLTEDQPKTLVQRLQNKMLRILNETLVSDSKSPITLLDNQNMFLVNQIAAQIKLTEMWKTSHGHNTLLNKNEDKRKTRKLKLVVLYRETWQKLEGHKNKEKFYM